MKICHISSVHPSRDTRIFYKECISLKKAGYDVTLIAGNNQTEETVGGIKIIDFPPFKNRLFRMLFAPLRMFNLARKQKAKLYHFHDPELIITGIMLRMMGKQVIFDIHENIVKQIKSKKFLLFPSLLSGLFMPFNFIACKWFHLILAEHSYEPIYKKSSKSYEIILNMPGIGFLEPYNVPDRSGLNNIFYIGRVTKLRGVDVSLKALHLLKHQGIETTMHFVGDIDEALKKELENLDYYDQIKKNVIFHGRMNLDDGYELAKDCLIGISVLKPIENYLESYSTKVFEYMAVSMPVITSNFELYKKVVEKHECGLCIDPEDPRELADAINCQVMDKERATAMGRTTAKGK